MIYLHPNLCPSRFGMQMSGNVQSNVSPMNRAIKRREFPGDLWIVRGEWPAMKHREFAAVEAFWNGFRGQAHTLRIWHMLRPEPYGTLRGSPFINLFAPEGSNQVSITAGVSGQTLLPGDMIGIALSGSGGYTQLCQVLSSTTVGTTLTVNITPPLRRAASVDAAVYWNRPTVDCVVTSPPFPTGVPVFGESFSMEAMEIPFK